MKKGRLLVLIYLNFSVGGCLRGCQWKVKIVKYFKESFKSGIRWIRKFCNGAFMDMPENRLFGVILSSARAYNDGFTVKNTP